MTDPRLDIYQHLPIYARMFDRRGVLLHFAQAMQMSYDAIDELLQRREFTFHPDFVPKEMIGFFGQLVGLAAADGHYLGIGINPEWPEAWQRDLLWRAIPYWDCKGTDKGVRMAVSMWLRYDEPFKIYLPFGKRPLATPPRWFGYGTRYDYNWNKTFEAKKVLGAGDYPQVRTATHKALVSRSYNWGYQSVYRKELEVSQNGPRVSRGSRIGPRNQWKHFYLTPENWNQIFPNLHTLDIEMLPVLTRPTNFGWLSFRSTVNIKPIIDDVDKVQRETRRHLELDGHQYPDRYPILGGRVPKTRLITLERSHTVAGNWSNATQYTTQFGQIKSQTASTSQTVTKTQFQQGVWPAASYGDIPSGMSLPEGSTTQPLVEVLVAGNWVPIEYQRDLYSSANRKTEVVSHRTEVVGKSGASYLNLYNRMPSWYAKAIALSIVQERTITGLTGGRPYYSPTYWAFRPARPVGSTSILPTRTTPKPRVLGGYCYSARIEQSRVIQRQSQVRGNYRQCFSYSSNVPRLPDAPPTPVDSLIIQGANPRDAAQYGDRFPTPYTEATSISYGGNWSGAARYNRSYGRPYYSPPLTGEKVTVRSRLPFLKMPTTGYAGKAITYTLTPTRRLPYATYQTSYGRAWFVPERIIATITSVRPVGKSVVYYRFARPKSTPAPLPVTATRFHHTGISHRYGSGKQWYFASQTRSHTETIALPPILKGGLSYYAPAKIKTITEVKDSPSVPTFRLQAFSAEYYFPTQKKITSITVPAPKPPNQCLAGFKAKILKGLEAVTTGGTPHIPSRMFVKKLPAITTGRDTTGIQAGIFPKNRRDWYPVLNRRLGISGKETIEIPAIPANPTNQILVQVQKGSTTTRVERRIEGNGWGRAWTIPYVQTRIRPLKIDLPDILTPIEMDFTLDISHLAPIEIAPTPDPFIRQISPGVLSARDYWYFPARHDVRETVTEIPTRYRLSNPKTVANYFQKLGHASFYYYPAKSGRPRSSETRETFGAFTVPAPLSYYLAPKRVPLTTKNEQGEKWRLIEPKKIATYQQQWGQTCAYDTKPQPAIPGKTTFHPVYVQRQLCNVANRFTTFKVKNWYEYTVDLPASTRPPVGELYPEFAAMNRSDNWTLSLETSKEYVQVHPSALFWTTEKAKLPDLNAPTAISFNREKGLTNLYIEFVIRLDKSVKLFSAIVNCERTTVFSDRFVEALNVHEDTIVGFKFLIQTNLMAKAPLNRAA